MYKYVFIASLLKIYKYKTCVTYLGERIVIAISGIKGLTIIICYILIIISCVLLYYKHKTSEDFGDWSGGGGGGGENRWF